jgi:hypothetical protein
LEWGGHFSDDAEKHPCGSGFSFLKRFLWAGAGVFTEKTILTIQ